MIIYTYKHTIIIIIVYYYCYVFKYIYIYIFFIHVCVGASVRAHPENIALNGTVTSHPSPLHNDPP